VTRTLDEFALPVARHHAVVHLARAHMDVDHVGDLAAKACPPECGLPYRQTRSSAQSDLENRMPTPVSDDDHQLDDDQNPGEDDVIEMLGDDHIAQIAEEIFYPAAWSSALRPARTLLADRDVEHEARARPAFHDPSRCAIS